MRGRAVYNWRKGPAMTVADNGTQDLVIPDLPRVREMMRHLQRITEASLGADAKLQIMESILSAEDEDALFGAQEASLVASKEYVDHPFRLMGAEDIQWRRARPEYVEQGGSPFWAIISVTDMETGQRVVLDAGGNSVTTFLMRSVELDDPSRGEKRFYEPYRAQGGRPLVFKEKAVEIGSVVYVAPYKILTSAPTRGKKN